MYDFEIDERLWQSHTLKFKIPAADLKARHLKEDALLEFEGLQYYITSVVRLRDNEKSDYEVEAEIAWMRLADIKRVGSFILKGETARFGLVSILNETAWSALQAPDTGSYSLEVQDGTILDLIWQWAKITGLEVSFETTSKLVNLVPQVGADTGLAFRYGRNLRTLKREAVSPSVTRMFVFGRNDLSINSLTTGAVSYIENYSYYTDQGLTLLEAKARYRKDEIYNDDSFIEAPALYDAAVARLAILSQPNVTYSGDVIDLSKLVHTTEYDFQCGDTVRVSDEPLDIDVNARVSRRVRNPYEPHKDKIELTFGPLLLPDPKTSTSRSDRSQEWELFSSRNSTTERRIRNFSTILHRIRLKTIQDSEWMVNFKVSGVGVGTGNVTITPVNDETGLSLVQPRTMPVVNGEIWEWSFTYAQKQLPDADWVMVIRATSDTAGVGIDVAMDQSAFWILARGTTRAEATLTNSVRYDYTGSIQTFLVPDDVLEILVECHGGAATWELGGKGGMVKGLFSVLAGDIYDVYVGKAGVVTEVSWPNGGTGATGWANLHGGSGGASTHLIKTGMSFANSLIVAAGAGGAGGSYGIGGGLYRAPGGDGGFYSGTPGRNMFWPGFVPPPSYDIISGYPGTHEGPGIGLGLNGSFGQGAAGSPGGLLASSGGAGGGGWYGGAGGRGLGSSADGGGGGCGWFDFASGYDIEIEDGENSGYGYMIISWETPDGE